MTPRQRRRLVGDIVNAAVLVFTLYDAIAGARRRRHRDLRPVEPMPRRSPNRTIVRKDPTIVRKERLF